VFVITPGTDLIGPTTRKKEYLSIPVSLNDLAGWGQHFSWLLVSHARLFTYMRRNGVF